MYEREFHPVEGNDRVHVSSVWKIWDSLPESGNLTGSMEDLRARIPKYKSHDIWYRSYSIFGGMTELFRVLENIAETDDLEFIKSQIKTVSQLADAQHESVKFGQLVAALRSIRNGHANAWDEFVDGFFDESSSSLLSSDNDDFNCKP